MSSTSSFPSFSGDSSEHSCNNNAAIVAAETHPVSKQHDMNAQQRPVSPVAKTLEEEKQADATLMNDERISKETRKNNNNASNIPSLLSPRNNRVHSMSPPNIVSSPMAHKNPVISSPPLPAAPPSTPYTPYVSVGGNGNILALHPPLPLAAVSTSPSSGYTLNHRRSSPPLMNQTTEFTLAQQQHQNTQPHNIPPIAPELLPPQLNPSDAARYNTMLNEALNETSHREKTRVASLTEHEAQNYTTIDEYKHALSRERRHSTSLAIELAQYKFLTRYTSCNIHSADEIDEERRINSLIKNIDSMKRNMNDEKCRVVMELEREEERIINGLMMRLEEVKKEKMLLETQIGNHVQSGSGGGAVDTDEQRSLHAQFGRMMAGRQGQEEQQQQQVGASETQQSTTAQQHEAAMVGSDRNSNNADNNTMEEDSEEEVEDDEEDYNEDILEGRHHDPEMEEELANLLKMKESK